ncbi:MAG: DUF4214 domain-containing protein [Oscillospiraceae bacterium]|nr:DUF4214 domain-containing protein [Oscillospiraceae bacterium]
MKTKKLISLVTAIAVILTLIPALPGAIYAASVDLTQARTDLDDVINLDDLWYDFEELLLDEGITLPQNEKDAVYNLLTDAIEEDGWKIDWHYSDHVVGYYTYICLEVVFIKGSDEFEVYFSWHEIEDSGDFRLMYVEAYGDKPGQSVVWDRLGEIINENWLLNENLSYYGEIDLFGLCNICKEDCGGDCYDILDYLGALFNETFEGTNDDLFIGLLESILVNIDTDIEVYEDLAVKYRAAFIAMEYEYCIGKCELDDCISCAGGYLQGIYYQPYWFNTDRTVLNYVKNSIVAAVDDVNEAETVPVAFNYMDGRPNTSVKVVKSGAITRPADPEREGYVFDGWYTNTSFTQSWNFNSTLEGLTSVGLYAKWTCVDHVYGEYVHNGDATCEGHGTETATCTHDNCTVTDTKPASSGALGHSFTTYSGDTATCIAGGKATATCDNGCGETDEKDTNPLGHDMVQTAAAIPATCTAAGTTALYACRRTGCDHTEGGEVIGVLGHDMVQTAIAISATCTINGKTAVLECSRGCGETEGGETIGALGHSFSGYTETLAPTCITDGVETRSCTRDCNETGHTETRPITERPDHNYTVFVSTTATCETAGDDTFECSTEGCIDTTTVSRAAGHTPKAANCTECSVCDETGLERTCTAASPCTFHTPAGPPPPTDSEPTKPAITPGNTPAPETETDFVQFLYLNAFGREPDSGGFDHWMEKLESGEVAAVDVMFAFVFSEEAKNLELDDEEFVTMLYRTFFGRMPDEGGFAHWMGRLENGESREAIFAGFANSVEFDNLCTAAGIETGSFSHSQTTANLSFVFDRGAYAMPLISYS